MNRLYDLVLLMVVAQAAIGFVNGVGMFTDPVYTQPDNAVAHWNIANSTDLGASNDVMAAESYNSDITLEMAFAAIGMIGDIFGAILFVYPALITTFMMPPLLAGVLQAAIYFIYAVFLIQMFWKPLPSEG